MQAHSPLKPVVVPAGAPGVLRAFGDEVIVHLGREQTGGKFTMFTDITPPGGGPPPHYHDHEDEWFYLLEGRASFLAEGQWCEVEAGSAVFVPRGAIHTFKNIGPGPLKQLIQTSPSGFEVFFARCAAEFQKPGGPDRARILAISAEHGIHFITP